MQITDRVAFTSDCSLPDFISKKALSTAAMRELRIASILEESGLQPNRLITKRFYRQVLCLCLRIAGQSQQECAFLLNVSEHTVKKHEQRLRERLNAANRIEAYRIARQKGYIIENMVS